MKRFVMAVCVCLAALTLVSSAFAVELWDFHLRGADEGLANGALPPPGLYFINDFAWTGNWSKYTNGGQSIPGAKLNAFVDLPVLLWNPGICPILGATYACAIAEPFDETTLRLSPPASPASLTGTQWGTYNTVLVPFILSWDIPCNLHVAASFAIGLNDGTTSPGDSLAAGTHIYGQQLIAKDGLNAYAWSSNNSYQFTPTLGISWLYAGWNISAEFGYTFYTRDNDCQIQNGDEMFGDYTATYTCGRWTFGVGAETQYQTFDDKGFNGLYYAKIPDSCAVNAAAGPIIGYNFGPCSLLFLYNFAITTKNDVGGDFAVLRLVIPLGNPCDWYR